MRNTLSSWWRLVDIDFPHDVHQRVPNQPGTPPNKYRGKPDTLLGNPCVWFHVVGLQNSCELWTTLATLQKLTLLTLLVAGQLVWFGGQIYATECCVGNRWVYGKVGPKPCSGCATVAKQCRAKCGHANTHKQRIVITSHHVHAQHKLVKHGLSNSPEMLVFWGLFLLSK